MGFESPTIPNEPGVEASPEEVTEPQEYDENAPIPPDFIPAEHICGRCGKSHPPEAECAS